MAQRGLYRMRRTWLLGLAVLAGLVWTLAAGAAPLKLEDYEVGPYALGGDFTLTNAQGAKTRLSQYLGKVVVLFFGYTYCPDVCPTTLSETGKMKQLLGRDASRV